MRALALRTRLTLFYTLAILVILSAFGANVWWAEGRVGVRRVDRELDRFSRTVSLAIQNEMREGGDLPLAAESVRRTIVPSGDAIAVLDARGTPIAANWNGLTVAPPLPSAAEGRRVWNAPTATGAWRVHSEAYGVDRTMFVLLVAGSLADARRAQHEVLEGMEVAIPMVLLLAGGGGFWLASVGLRPITEMAGRAARMPPGSVEDLGHAERTDELGQLARAFNGLVARLRAALHTQQQFMADASHELRTPVSIVRTATDVALSREQRDENDYRETLAIVGDQSRRLGRLVDNMLVLARADAGGYPLRPVDLYLDEVVTECCRALHVLSTERRVAMTLAPSPEVPFRGDEDLLRQLLLNVVQNALQHTPPGGIVSVDLSQDEETIVVRVSDTGPGIPAADQSRIFDRFVQLDNARRGAGAGLGLPIARWIAEIHRGSLVLERSDDTGSTFRISLPVQV